jgi:hypothetical protein
LSNLVLGDFISLGAGLRRRRCPSAWRRRAASNVGARGAFPGECWMGARSRELLHGRASSLRQHGAAQHHRLRSIPRGMLDGGWFVGSIARREFYCRGGNGPTSVLEEHSPGNARRRLVPRIRLVPGDSICVVQRGADDELCHLCNRIIAAVTISLDATFRRLRSPVTNEKPDDGISLEIRVLCAQCPRLVSREDVLRMVAASVQTTTGKPVLQASS